MQKHERQFIRTARDAGLTLIQADRKRRHPQFLFRRPDGTERWFTYASSPKFERDWNTVADLRRFATGRA